MAAVKLSGIIAPTFAGVHNDIKKHGHTHYWLKGGRGSTKSSFISVEIPLGMMRDAAQGEYTNAIVLRRYGVTLRESVFEQIGWAINALGVAELWKSSVSPMSWTYLPTGQRIIFRGADDPTKVKSIKFAVGWAKYLWYEEVNEFEGAEKIRSINQSVLRGGADFFVFYSFNPPQAARNWVNQYVAIERDDALVHHSTYLTVPPQWLGEQFIVEAEHLKAVKPEAYRHEYLGEVTGTGGEVFGNVTLRPITDEEISRFDNLRRGIDWGYARLPTMCATTTRPAAGCISSGRSTRSDCPTGQRPSSLKTRPAVPGSPVTAPSPRASTRSEVTACGWWGPGKDRTVWSTASSGCRTWRRSSLTRSGARKPPGSSPDTSWSGTGRAFSKPVTRIRTTIISMRCGTPARTI